MITPKFSLSQTPDNLIVTVMVPYCNVGEMEMEIVDDCLMFSCFPYYLKLSLPGSVREECEGVSYCFISDSVKITLQKKWQGEEFKELDLYPKLLINKEKPNEENGLVLENEEEKGDSYSFGFAIKGNKRFATVAQEFLDLFDIDPTKVTVNERRYLKLELEQNKFNSTQYLVDLDDEEINYVIQQNAPWNCSKENLNLNINGGFKEDDFFKNHQKTVLNGRDLTPLEETYCLNGLIDILYAYCYDRRTTYFEGTCESSWTISKLSATLSCFCVFDNAREAMVSAYRRTLIYPLYRNFDLAKKTFQDIKAILKLGRDYVVQCFLNIYQVFAKSGYYILNNLFINDYIYYVKFSKEDVCEKALKELQQIKLRKNDLGLKLHVYEELNDIALDSFNNYPILSDDSDDNTEET